MVDYNLDIPNAPNNPSADQPLMKTNTNAINTLIGVDHIPFNTANGGYHTIIHQVDRLSTPSFIPGINQLFSMIPPSGIPNSINDQLFSLNDGGGLSQLTGYSALASGYCWSGGILFQWKIIPNPANGTVYSFPVAFPNNLFNIQLTPFVSDDSTVRCYILSGSLSLSGFTLNSTVTSKFTSMYISAIGN